MFVSQLLGHIDMDTREWTDGVLTYSARQVVREPIGELHDLLCPLLLHVGLYPSFILHPCPTPHPTTYNKKL